MTKFTWQAAVSLWRYFNYFLTATWLKYFTPTCHQFYCGELNHKPQSQCQSSPQTIFTTLFYWLFSVKKRKFFFKRIISEQFSGLLRGNVKWLCLEWSGWCVGELLWYCRSQRPVSVVGAGEVARLQCQSIREMVRQTPTTGHRTIL